MAEHVHKIDHEVLNLIVEFMQCFLPEIFWVKLALHATRHV